METTDNVIARIEAGNLMKYETLLKHSRAQDARVAELEAALRNCATHLGVNKFLAKSDALISLTTALVRLNEINDIARAVLKGAK